MMYTNPYLSYPYSMQQYQAQPQGMTPPMVHADIIQVSGEQEAINYPVAVGSSQLMMARDDSAFYVKTVSQDRQPALVVYEKRTEKAAAANEFVTRDELKAALEAMRPARKTTKEAAEE